MDRPFCVLGKGTTAMTTAQEQAFDAKVEKKINEMMPYIVKMSGGDQDLIQIGTIGIWESMMKEPEASNKYYATKAKWDILQQINGVGKSVDIPKKAYKRKTPISIVHYDAILSQAVLADRRRIPLDDYVINKMDFERFINNLYSTEAEYVRCKIVEELPDKDAADRMDWSLEKVRFMKKKLRDKIEVFFGW